MAKYSSLDNGYSEGEGDVDGSQNVPPSSAVAAIPVGVTEASSHTLTEMSECEQDQVKHYITSIITNHRHQSMFITIRYN